MKPEAERSSTGHPPSDLLPESEQCGVRVRGDHSLGRYHDDAPDIGVPWLTPRRGRSNVPAFFESLGGVEMRRFEPKTLLEGDAIVVAIIALEFVVKSTGRTVREDDEVHIWRFDGNGKVISFRHKVDSHQHYLALQPK